MTDETLHDDHYTGRFNLHTWRQLFSFTRPYRRHVAILCLAAVTLAGIECILAWLPRQIIDSVEKLGPEAPLARYIGWYMVVVTAFALIVFLFIRCAGRISTGVSHDIRRDCFNHLQTLSFSFYDKRQAGWLVARLTGDCDRMSRSITWGIMLDMVWGTCMILSVSAMLLYWNLKLGLIVLATLPFIAAAGLYLQKKIIRASREVRRLNSTITASFSECIMGLLTTRTLVRETENLRDFTGRIDDMYEASIRNAILSSALWPVVMAISGTGAALALWKGGHGVMAGEGNPGHVSIGTLVQFINTTTLLMFPILEMSRVFADLQSTQAAAERVFGLLNTEPEVKDSPKALAAIEAAAGAAGFGPQALAVDGMPDRLDRIEFRNVSFAYEAGKPVLKNFSLDVPPGSTIALVGPTGGGKTTIASLVCRFYEPTEGEILIDGVEYRDRSLDWLQSRLGIVLQQPHLFSGTVRENIRYGRLDATDAEVEQAARLVRADGFIAEMDAGYDSEVGEGGSRLSTGQKQLISFARAVLADPRIFVMDEATSSVDTETEQLIQQGLSAVLSGRISFVIAHRLSTIRSADRILLIDAGEVAEQGTHAELMAHRGRYWQLYTNQFTEQQTEQLLAAQDDEEPQHDKKD